MASLLTMGLNFMHRKKAERALLILVKRHRGQLVNVPSGPGKEYYAVAAQALVDKHPAVTIHRFQDQLALCFRADAEAVLPKSLHDAVDRSGFVAQPGDDPFTVYDPEYVRRGAK
mgnify:CR=1 FL=1